MKDIEPGQQAYLNTLIERYPVLKSCEKDLTEAYCLLRDSYKAGGKLLVAGMVDQLLMQNTSPES